jgi:hypothetical protein
LSQRGRQTGGVLPDARSDRALSDRYLLHGDLLPSGPGCRHGPLARPNAASRVPPTNPAQSEKRRWSPGPQALPIRHGEPESALTRIGKLNILISFPE